MKNFKNIFFSIFLFSFACSQAQTIKFNGCHALFENQDYVFNYAGTDEMGRNFYTTTPVDGAQTCGGVGTCEFMIKWSVTNSKWEFIADSGNGDFITTFLIYSNISNSSPKPPDLTLGTWLENTATTISKCGGNLNSSNATLTGDIQSTILGIKSINPKASFIVYPNPVKDVLQFSGDNAIIERISIMNTQGQRVLNNSSNSKEINVSKLESGIYFLTLKSNEGISVYKFVKE